MGWLPARTARESQTQYEGVMSKPVQASLLPTTAHRPAGGGASFRLVHPATMIDRLRRSWRNLREQRSLHQVSRRWREVRSGLRAPQSASRPPRTLLLVPSDPWTLVAAGGSSSQDGRRKCRNRPSNLSW